MSLEWNSFRINMVAHQPNLDLLYKAFNSLPVWADEHQIRSVQSALHAQPGIDHDVKEDSPHRLNKHGDTAMHSPWLFEPTKIYPITGIGQISEVFDSPSPIRRRGRGRGRSPIFDGLRGDLKVEVVHDL
jgi:hypothetical protein